MLRKCKFGSNQTKNDCNLHGDQCTFMTSSVTSATMVATDSIRQEKPILICHTSSCDLHDEQLKTIIMCYHNNTVFVGYVRRYEMFLSHPLQNIL